MKEYDTCHRSSLPDSLSADPTWLVDATAARTVVPVSAARLIPTPTSLRVRNMGVGSELVSYLDGLSLQREIHRDVVAGLAPPTLLILEHEATFTAGKRTEPTDLTDPTVPVIETDRGGRITWHGPGQIVGYPIVPLTHPLDVVAYVRLLEQIMIDTCAQFGVSAVRVDGRSGTWCEPDDNQPARKVGAVGVRVAAGVAMHGFAVNVNCDLSWASDIVPCGISDAGVTSLAREVAQLPGHPQPTTSDVLGPLQHIATAHLTTYLGTSP